jgi:hypothetical protein
MNGFSVSTAGDVNGDGLDDLIIGSHRVDLNGKSEVGKSYVIFGKTNTVAGIDGNGIVTCTCVENIHTAVAY